MNQSPAGAGQVGPVSITWAKRDSNPRHPACKAGALNQLSYSPVQSWRSTRYLLRRPKDALFHRAIASGNSTQYPSTRKTAAGLE